MQMFLHYHLSLANDFLQTTLSRPAKQPFETACNTEAGSEAVRPTFAIIEQLSLDLESLCESWPMQLAEQPLNELQRSRLHSHRLRAHDLQQCDFG